MIKITQLINLLMFITVQAHAAPTIPHKNSPSKKSSARVRQISSEKEFQGVLDQARKTKKAVVVKFHAPWCSACTSMEKTFETYAQKAGPGIIAIAINTDSTDLAPIVETFHIQELPTFATIHLTTGARSLDDLCTLLDAQTGTKTVSKKRG